MSRDLSASFPRSAVNGRSRRPRTLAAMTRVPVNASSHGYPDRVDESARLAQRETSRAHVRSTLGIEPTYDALLARIGTQIDAVELDAVNGALQQTSPDRRPYAIAAVAAASLAMDVLGAAWWRQARPRSDGVGGRSVCSPASLVRADRQSGLTGVHPARGSATVEVLEWWAGDDVADHLWGPAVGYVDMNNPRTIDRFPVPADARPGDRLLLSFDPGCRIEAVVEQREGDTLGTRLDGEVRFAPPADLWWHWVTATKTDLP